MQPKPTIACCAIMLICPELMILMYHMCHTSALMMCETI